MDFSDILVLIAVLLNIGVMFFKSFKLMNKRPMSPDELQAAKILTFQTFAISLISWFFILGYLVTLGAAGSIALLKMSVFMFNFATAIMSLNGFLTILEVMAYYSIIPYGSSNGRNTRALGRMVKK